MGIDIEAGGRVKSKARVTKSANPYIRLLCKLYKFLARRTDSKFNKVIFKRLNMTRKSKPPLSLQKLAKLMAGKAGGECLTFDKLALRSPLGTRG
mmetsp:Transcript_118247/g.376946  ORF Transcript_118247/g.376946 Transcript_118247/m.376946 type:complete len:95 (-) Transcript_118247:208-492(-)